MQMLIDQSVALSVTCEGLRRDLIYLKSRSRSFTLLLFFFVSDFFFSSLLYCMIPFLYVFSFSFR